MTDNESDVCFENEVQKLGNIFQLKCLVNPRAYGRMIGQQGIDKNRIETETKTKIVFPKREEQKENWIVTIRGKSKEDVCAARKQYRELIPSIRKYIPETHLILCPVRSECINKSLDILKKAILSEGFPGIDEHLFSSPLDLHITLVSCQLIDAQDQAKAIKIIEECCRDFRDKKTQFLATACGLNIFEEESSSDVKVLFTEVKSEQLQVLANNITHKIKDSGLCKELRHDPSNLHMTIMNSRHRAKINSEEPKRFDCTPILVGYSDFEFGNFVLNEIHLSEMGSADDSGLHKNLHKVSI